MSGGEGLSAWRGLLAIWRATVMCHNRFEAHDGTAMAGYIAFSAFLSIFPFAIFFSALAGIVVGPEDSRLIFDTLVDLAPEHITKTLMPVLYEVIGQSRGGVLTFAGLGAIWVASNAAEAVRVAFDRAYGVTSPRHVVYRRLVAIGFVFIAFVTFTVLGFLIIFAPLALNLARDMIGFTPPIGLNAVRYILGVATFTVFLLMLNRWLPSKAPSTRQTLPGIAVATILWIGGASLFSIYLAFAPSYTVTYGAFAGVIVTLLFFYLTGAVVIFGAEVNATLVALRHEKMELT